MSQFTYQPYHSPYVTTLAELMQEPGRAQAQAAVQSGQAWGQAAGQIGQIAGAVPQQIQQQQFLQQQTALHGVQLDEAQKAAKFRDALSLTLKNTPQQTEDGVSVYDVPAISKTLADQGYGAYTGDVVKSLSGLNDAFRAERAAKTALVQRGAQEVQRAGNDPTFANHFLDQLEKNSTYPPEQINQFRQFIAADPANVAKLTAALAGPQKLGAAPKGSTIYNETTGATVATVPNDPDEGAYTINGQRFRKDGTPVGTQVPPQATPAAAQTHNMRLKGVGDVPVDYVPNKDGTGGRWMYQGKDVTGEVAAIPPASLTIHNENAQGPNLPAWALDDSRPTGPEANAFDRTIRLTPNGLYQAAQTYIATGQYPQTGRGSDPASQATRAAINAKVGAIAAASGMDEPALRAFYKANSQSLSQQVKMSDAVQGFMATADKNAALLEKSLKEMPDSGSPLLNQPLRAFMKSVVGKTEMAPIGTYLQSVSNEYAKIISQPTLAGQLTDSARKETEALLNPNATVAQMIASLRALNTEGTNRLVSIGEQIQRIQQRMQGAAPGNGAPQGNGTGQPQGRGGAPGVMVTAPNGRTYSFPDQAAADRFVADAKAKDLWR